MRYEDMIEDLRKNALPVHPKCLGLEFTETDEKHRVGTRCERIVPEEIYEIIDEETGAVDPESKPEVVIDGTCRCNAYTNPSVFWRRGICPLATHIKAEDERKEFVRVGQQKQKKKK